MSDKPTVEQVEQTDNINELRAIAKQLELSGGGSKDDLRARIIDHLKEPTPAEAALDRRSPEEAGQVPDAPQAEPEPGQQDVPIADEVLLDDADVDPATVDVDSPALDGVGLAEGSRKIERVGSNGAWWCPFCDTSNHSTFIECGGKGCGAERDGDTVDR